MGFSVEVLRGDGWRHLSSSAEDSETSSFGPYTAEVLDRVPPVDTPEDLTS